MTYGYLCLDSWAGRTETLVEIVAETPKRYRIRALSKTKLAGRYRWLEEGQTTLVPKLLLAQKFLFSVVFYLFDLVLFRSSK